MKPLRAESEQMLASLMEHMCFHPTYRCSTLCFSCFPVLMTAVHASYCFGPPIFGQRNISGMLFFFFFEGNSLTFTTKVPLVVLMT